MYNATVYEIRDGKLHSRFVAEAHMLAGRVQMYRSNALQCTGFEGAVVTEDAPEHGFKSGDCVYDSYLRAVHPDSTFVIDFDDCEGYRSAIGRSTAPLPDSVTALLS